MRRLGRICAPLLLLCAVHGLAQTSPILVGLGYHPASVIMVAPGQIIRLDIAAPRTVLPLNPATNTREVRATSVPLPDSLAGVSVTLRQTFYVDHAQTGQSSFKLPLIAIEQWSVCSDLGSNSPECFRSTITAQVPFELSFLTAASSPPTDIVISDGGVDSPAFVVGAVSDAIHFVTTCDRGESGCASIVAHADGSLITPESPARQGEVVVIYAWGLGSTSPAVKTGELTPAPAPVLGPPGPPGDIVVEFDFRPNAGPSNPESIASTATAYLTPGQVGLYQINVQLPSSFPHAEGCSGITGVFSNLTINIRRSASFDGAAICVQPVL